MASNIADSHTSVVVIVCYFGRLPDFFDLFLASCEKNPTINWVVVTDDRASYRYPDNVTPCYLEFSEVRERFQRLFDFEIALDRPYKICDFRPAFGLAFNDLIDGCEFWGHSDVDLIYGNIRKFLTEDVFKRNDKILGFGHLSFYRNNDEMRSAFKAKGEYGSVSGAFRSAAFAHFSGYSDGRFLRSVDRFKDSKYPVYKTVFSENEYLHFDEWNLKNYGYNDLLLDTGKRLYDGRDFANLYIPTWHFCLSKFTNLTTQHPEKSCIFHFQDGDLYRLIAEGGVIKRDEFVYLHIQKRPMENCFQGESPGAFVIMPNRFAPMPPNLSYEYIKQKSRKRIFYGPYFKFKFQNLLKKFGKKV